jgi:UDP-glucose:(heptosyl)LPS alpha-1,3-glucosyltransferase
MRVAIVHEHVDARRGGAETSVLEMAGQLSRLGADVTIVTSAMGAQRPALDNMAVHFVPLAGTRLGRAIRFVAEADRYNHDQRFDIVHAVTPCFSANVYQPRGGTYAETVTRSVARGRTPIGRAIKRLGRRLNRRQRFLLLAERRMLTSPHPPFVAAVSQYVAGHVRRDFPRFPRDHVRVVLNGVNAAPLIDIPPDARQRERAALGVGLEQKLILFVAHNFKLKGLGELLRACALLPAQVDWRLAVAGRDDPVAYERLAAKLHIRDRVRILGAQRNLPALYAAADVLAHPTWFDPCSRVVLEALCAGLPAVTTRYNGAAEAIDPQVNGGVIAEPSDVAGLAAEIERCLDPALRDKCRQAAEDACDRLSMARHARELVNLYELTFSH